ncbi:MAG TPA: helix-turn-helix domain-containing protein [Planctomycetota bacterium]|nr:helix-turn-helix domain-containing protein [Planctomycetota bacterium]
MARALRIDVPDGVYYVTSRGLEGQGIVRDETDCGKWFGLLDAVATRRRWRVFACVLMPSHFHLFLETPDADLSAGMHDLNSGYAAAFNRRHGRSGPLLRGRFKAILIEPGYRCWELSRHIHLNPVRAGLVKRPQDYPYGSCEAYLGTALAPVWLAWREVMQGHGATMVEARETYERFLAEGVERPPVSPLWAATASVVLGSGQFVGRMQMWLDGKLPKLDVPAARALRRTVGVEAIEKAVCAVFGVAEERLHERHRWGNEARAAALYLCRKWTAMKARELGERFGGIGAPAVSMAASQVARRLHDDKGLAERIGRCEAELGLDMTAR